METFIDILSNFGFPVAVCGVLMWYIYHIQNTYREQISEIMKEHKEETSKITEAINSNTLVMQKLVDRLSGDKRDV